MEKFTQLPYDTWTHGAPTLLRHCVTPIGYSDNILLQLNTTLIFPNREEFSTAITDSVTFSKVAGGQGRFQEKWKSLFIPGLQPKYRVSSLSKRYKKVKEFSATHRLEQKCLQSANPHDDERVTGWTTRKPRVLCSG